MQPLLCVFFRLTEAAAQLADMFGDDAAGFGAAKARINAAGSVARILCPLLGGMLAARSIRLPYLLGGALSAVNIVVGKGLLRETLPVARRVPLRWKMANPLSFLGLFRNKRGGAPLRLLCFYSLWSAISGSSGSIYQLREMHRQRLLKWSLPQRGRYESFTGLLSLPQALLSGLLMRALGARGTLALGNGGSALSLWLSAQVTSLRQLYAVGVLETIASDRGGSSSLGFITAGVGAAAGIPQGQLQGALSNLQTTCQILSPLLWSKIYDLGLLVGRPALFFSVAAVGAGVQLLLGEALCRSLRRSDGAKAQSET